MSIGSIFGQLFSFTRFIALTISLVWLLLVARYLEVKPQYATREYLKLLYDGTKNNGIVRMNTVNHLNHPQNTYTNSNNQSNNIVHDFIYFNLLNLAQGKSKINCQAHLNLLIINANYKQVGQNYLAIYKQIQRQSIYCKHEIYQLNRKEHLLMNSELLIQHYAVQVAITIQSLTRQHTPLTILTFQQGCSILIKTLEIISPTLLQKLGAIILVNAFNPNLQVVYENPSVFINKSQQIMQLDHKKMSVLNNTRMIFISTTKFWDELTYNDEDRGRFTFLWNGKRLKQTLHLNTRFMKNIYALLHENDYFALSQLPSKIVKFLIIDSNKKRKIQDIEYFFNYGELYGKVDFQLKNTKSRLCSQARLSRLTKVTKIYKTMCLIINISQKLKQNENETILITISKQSYIFNERFQKIQSIYQNSQHSFYIIETAKNTKQINIINPNKNQILIQFQKPYSPIANPLPQDFFTLLGPQSFIQKIRRSSPSQHKLIKTCPQGNYLVFPEHYRNYYSQNSLITSFAVYSLNQIFIEHFQVYQNTDCQQDCYPDFFSQIRLFPKQLLINWQFQRNFLFFILICSYTRKQSIFQKYYLYLLLISILKIIHLNTFNSFQIFLSSALLTISIIIQTFINIIIHLVKFIQQLLDIRYRKIIILVIIFISFIKTLQNNIFDAYQISAWKLLCISLIFIVNRENIVITLCKLYFVAEHVVYNHNDCLEISMILIWIYSNLDGEGVGVGDFGGVGSAGKSEKQKSNQFVKNGQNSNSNSSNSNNNGSNSKKNIDNKKPQTYQPRILQTALVVLVAIFLDGYTKYINLSIGGYIVVKTFFLLLSKDDEIQQ